MPTPQPSPVYRCTISKQVVYESNTKTGARGLFTYGLMVWPLEHGEDARAIAERCGFEFIERPS